MRRSLRDAFVGFSLLGGLVIFSGAMLWLRDFRLGSKHGKYLQALKMQVVLPRCLQLLIGE